MTKSSVFSIGSEKEDKNAQMVEHSSCNEGVVMRVEGVKQSNSVSIIRLNSTHRLDYCYKNQNPVNTWTMRLCLCFDKGVN